MNSEDIIRKIDTDISNPNVIMGVVVLFLLPFIDPIINKTIDKLANFAHDAMEHDYDIKVKVGPVDIELTKKL
jgi:hypothetical protein